MDYSYTNISTTADINNIHIDVQDSSMTDKTLEGCFWHSDSQILIARFINTLSAGDKTILDTIVNNNLSIPAISSYKISGDSQNPKHKNINLFGLHRKDNFNARGELVIKEYYKNYNGTTYSDLVVKDSYDYTTDSGTDLVQYRDEIIEWYLEDDTIGETKNIKKYYGTIKAIKEGVRRRHNLLDQAKAYGLGTITGTHASGVPNSYYWFTTMSVEVRNYLDGTIKTDIIDFIDNETETYVTQTIKDTMTDILDYWTV